MNKPESNVINLSFFVSYEWARKVIVCVAGKSFQPSILFQGKARKTLPGPPLLGRLLALPANIRVDRRGLRGRTL